MVNEQSVAYHFIIGITGEKMATHTPLNRKRIKEPSELDKEIGRRFKDFHDC